MTRQDELKREAAAEALTYVTSGMRLGLGTGSTMAHFVDLLGQAMAEGRLRDIVGVPTSVRTERQARDLNIPLAALHELSPLDLAVDGADEVDPGLDLIKGLGGALLREKMIAQAAQRFVIVADGSKLVTRLGSRSPLPVEVVPFAWEAHRSFLSELGATPVLRRDVAGEPTVTDNGNLLLDCAFEQGIADPIEVERRLSLRAGVVDTGLFLGLADTVVVADGDGISVRRREGAA
ncbi:MAG: ribose-5-phosphate isomerase RpiA [Gemmatimonadetes bacterium]|nr:ribose-5-phosphate isomerase RpiA [Gemmatimonadota bacterium]